MVYENFKVYGPYTRKDGRQHVCLVGRGNERKTVSYPKFLVETRFDRYLDENETVDHIDGNFLNNAPENLQVLQRSVHAALDAKRLVVGTVTCPLCGKRFTPTQGQVHTAVAGPFCSKRCTGRYGASVQNGGNTLGKTAMVVTYTTQKEQQLGKPVG